MKTRCRCEECGRELEIEDLEGHCVELMLDGTLCDQCRGEKTAAGKNRCDECGQTLGADEGVECLECRAGVVRCRVCHMAHEANVQSYLEGQVALQTNALESAQGMLDQLVALATSFVPAVISTRATEQYRAETKRIEAETANSIARVEIRERLSALKAKTAPASGMRIEELLELLTKSACRGTEPDPDDDPRR